MELIQNDACELSDFSRTDIQIKNEPIEIPEDSFTSENSTWSYDTQEYCAVKEEEEETIPNPETEELDPINTVDVKPVINELISESEENSTWSGDQQEYFAIKQEELDEDVSNSKIPLKYFKIHETSKKIAARKMRMKRAMETEEQRRERLRKDRERVARKRAAERQIADVYQERLKQQREKVAQRRSEMTLEQRLDMLKRDREYKRLKRLKQKLCNNSKDTNGESVPEGYIIANNMFTCLVCNNSFGADFNFKDHYISHFQTHNFFCEFCDQGFFYLYDLTEHKLSHINQTEPFKCDICLSQHSSWKDLFIHCKNFHTTNNLKLDCDICHESFLDRKSLKDHVKIHPGEKKEIVPPERKKVLCEICGKFMSCYQSFQNHYRIHTGEKPYVCKECGRSFTAYVGLYFHSRIHTGQRPYKCEDCGKTFAQRSSFAIHLKLHNGEKPYHCKICGKSYVTSSLLNVHMKNTHKNVL